MSRPGEKQFASAAERNKDPLLQVLSRHLAPRGQQRCLEVASGTGQHVVHFAAHLPRTEWQPSEVCAQSLASIAAHVRDSGLPNVRPPIHLDACARWDIPQGSMDVVLCVNMFHIAPYACAEGLFANASRVLTRGGLLITYGPYAFDGNISPESNIRFDAMLRAEDPAWGLRDVRDLAQLARAGGMELMAVEAMPANNHTLVWVKL